MRKKLTELEFKIMAGLIAFAVVVGVIGRLVGKQVLVSNFLFMVGMVLILVAVVIMLFHGSLLGGWFHRHRGEKIREFKARIPSVKEIVDQKNKPIHFGGVTQVCLYGGLAWIVVAVVCTLV